MMRFKESIAAMVLVIAVGCHQDEVSSLEPIEDGPVFKELPGEARARMPANSGYAILSAEYLVAAESGKAGRTIYFSDVGNKQVPAHFVSGLDLDNTSDVSYYIDENRPSEDLPVAVTSQAITRAMSTWDAVVCSEIGLYQIPSSRSTTTGFVSAAFGFGGSPEYVADVVHAGWLPGEFFDLLAEDGSEYILAVTFTLAFTDEEGNVTDLNGDGKIDVAWAEIYYNDAVTWNDGDHYDVETIALHEAGHGLSQDHFGKAFLNPGTGFAQFSPRAVMNAAYSGIQTEIDATDNAGHCSIWASWPNN